MLSQERKEEVDGNPPISHALSSQVLLWRQDSAWVRTEGRAFRKGSTSVQSGEVGRDEAAVADRGWLW